MKRFFISFSFSLFLTFSFFAQESTKSVAHNSKGWSSAFQEKTFVKNLGQFPVLGKDSVLFYTAIRHGFIYFTNDGYGYVQGENEVKRSKRRKKRQEHLSAITSGSGKKMTRTQWVKFNNSSSAVVISGVEVQSNYHTHDNLIGVKIPVYKKIKYTNVYPNIDFVFELTTQEEGLKYDIVVRPGGDPNDIGIEYKKANTIRVDSLGQVVIDSKFGTFTESIPESFIEKTNKPVSVNFEVNNGLIQFSCGKYPKRETLIIDPFVTNSVFTTPVYPPFQIDYDFAGNVYASSFEPVTIFFPPGSTSFVVVWEKVTIKKFSPTGVLLWTNVKGDMDADFGHEYPFTVNRATQDIFGHSARRDSPAALMRKLNSAGITVDSLSLTGFMMGNSPLIVEVFTMEYDHCNDKILVGSGADLHAISIDHSLSGAGRVSGNLFPSPASISPGVDCMMMRFDLYEDSVAYMVFCTTDPTNPTASTSPTYSQITKTGSNISSYDWTNSTVHPFVEAYTYIVLGTDTIMLGNHFNGVSPGLNYTFVYDTDSISVYNKTTGALVQIGNIVSPVGYTFVPINPLNPTLSKNVYFNSMGIAVDVCDNVYVAVGDTIKCYDFNLNLLDQFATGGAITDLRYGDNNILYASGDNFVQAIDPEIAFPNVHPLFSFVVTPDSCSAAIGAISIIGCPNLDSLDITWSLGGQKTKDISGLTTGWYSVSITADSIMSCNGFSYTFTDSVFVADLGSNCNLNVALENDTICIGDTASLLAIFGGNQGPVRFEWDNGITDTTAGPIAVSPLVTTIYTVIIIDSMNFEDTTTATVFVLPIPVFSLGNDTTLCSSGGYFLSSGITGVNHLWSTGDTSSSIRVNTSGTYILTTDNGGCTYSDTVVVSFLVNPLNLGNDTLLCGTNSFTLDATSPGFTYFWDDSSVNPARTVTTSGTYFVTITDGNCVYSDTIQVSLVNITVQLGNDTVLCPNQSLLLTANTSGAQPNSYLWSTGDTFSSINVTSAQTYWVEVDTAGCLSADTINVSYVALALDLGNDTLLCQGQNVVLNAQNPGATYLWSTLATSQTINVNASGSYVVTVTNQGCSISDTIEISVQSATAFFPGDPVSGCVPVTVSFTDNSVVSSGSITAWNWDFGNGNTSTVQNPTHTYNTAGNFSVTLSVTTNLGCTDQFIATNYVEAFVNAEADFSFTPTEIETNREVNFTNLSTNAISWKWLFGDGDSSTVRSPIHSYSNEGTYTVTLIAISPNGCNDTVQYLLTIQNKSVVYVPNTFSPNKDGKNETWRVYGIRSYKSFSLVVFNRWGEIVYEATDPSDEWDGSHLGEQVPIGVYVWKVQLEITGEGTKELNGHINLVR